MHTYEQTTDFVIVVDDPSGEYWEGALLPASRAGELGTRDIATLPVDPTLFTESGVGGFCKRAWGAGIPLLTPHPKRLAPLTIYVSKRNARLNWAVRLVRDASVLGVEDFNGILRIAADTAQPQAMAGGLGGRTSPTLELSALGAPDARGGWTVGGTYEVHPDMDGYLGLALYGTAPGLRVAWAALSQTA